MTILGFDAKALELYTDSLRGVARLHPDVRALLFWLCDLCEKERLARPFVTEFGRTRDDQEAIYLPTMLQALAHEGVHDAHALAQAKAAARAKFSWHCIALAPGGELGCVRAFDLRYSVWSDLARSNLLDAVRRKYPHAEVLDHRVVGGSRHVHLGLPDPAGRPLDWI